GAAMSIGNMARTNEDFPNPHRVLNSSGKVPENWTTLDGSGGPEVCRARLTDEGVTFSSDRADQDKRVPVEELARRLAS
ncbi:MAG: hypothetical protein AAGK32_05795, partial [Actinomycetota bacterium]